MELSDIHKEISEIEDFRWKYFDTNPEATENDRTQAVEGRIVKLLEVNLIYCLLKNAVGTLKTSFTFL